MKDIVTISYTGLSDPGGVPRWNRDLHSAFPDRKCVHYCWGDAEPSYGGPDRAVGVSEWDKARFLNFWLKAGKKLTSEEIVFVDGFWGLGLEWHPNVISISHGNWSHTTADDVAKGIPPEFPHHHRVQLKYRQDHLTRGGRIVAVSKFIADQCRLQWGMEFQFINNGIDTEKFFPGLSSTARRPVVIHGTTTANKGFEHIETLRQLDADVWLLDEAAQKMNMPKYEALACCDLVVHPSAHEGNSYFVLEALACGRPIVSYNVGLMWEYWENKITGAFGKILDRNERSPTKTLEAVRHFLSLTQKSRDAASENARTFAKMNSIEKFRQQWKEYVDNIG